MSVRGSSPTTHPEPPALGPSPEASINGRPHIGEQARWASKVVGLTPTLVFKLNSDLVLTVGIADVNERDWRRLGELSRAPVVEVVDEQDISKSQARGAGAPGGRDRCKSRPVREQRRDKAKSRESGEPQRVLLPAQKPSGTVSGGVTRSEPIIL